MRPTPFVLLVAVAMALVVAAPPAGSVASPFLDLAWTRVGSGPVVPVGPTGSWDRYAVIPGAVLSVDGTYHMFYTGNNGTAWAIGHATSADGINWTKDPANPILTGAQSPVVLHEDGIYKMWYVNDLIPSYAIEYATSPDGTGWARYALNPILTVSASGWDSSLITTGAILHDASGYRLWYTGTADHLTFQGGLATSPDGLHWAKYAGNPVLRPDELGAWTSGFVTPCSVFSDGTALALWFVGGTAGAWQLGVAVSPDGTNWTGGSGPVLSPVSGSWDSTMISRASVLRVQDRMFMWYTGAGGGVQQTGLAEAPYPGAMPPWFTLQWMPFSGNPVLTIGPPGAWDSDHVVGGPVLLVNGTYRTWYVGSADNQTWGTGTATSRDGTNWTKDAANPVIPYDGGSQVLYENGTYRMWYSYMYPDAGAVPWQVWYATSEDGVHWRNVVNYSVLNVTAGAWDSVTLSPGPVIHDAQGYRMWYGATSDGMAWDVGLATSPDGLHWTKYAGNPIIVPPFAGAWDNFRVHPSSILPMDGGLVMWYVSDDTSLVQRIGVAVSSDGIRWTPSPTPVMDVGANGTWDAASLSRLSVIRLGNFFQMWFTGINAPLGMTRHWQVGYAIASLNEVSNGTLLTPPIAHVGGSQGSSAVSSPPAASLPAASPPWPLVGAAVAGAGIGATTFAVWYRLRQRRRPR